ncbi:MAG: hypothetical protein J6Q71_01765, partial [Bacteroidales bacterium]|nr:hypothetical protein [Bacteroidales bacterium]
LVGAGGISVVKRLIDEFIAEIKCKRYTKGMTYVVPFFVHDAGLCSLRYWQKTEHRVDNFYLRGKILN